MNQLDDNKIIDSWKKNALQWTSAIRDDQIESRNLVTNEAIIEAVLSHSPDSIIDIGCGEGWLVRALSSKVAHLVGVDAVPALINQAKIAGGGDFLVATYDDIAHGFIKETFDMAICNFSLIGKESVESLFSCISSLLKPGGVFIVQTLHPLIACGDLPYVNGWREGSWTGFSTDFIDPAPWYFRTIESWQRLFMNNSLRLLEMREPIHPKTNNPASIIFVGRIDEK